MLAPSKASPVDKLPVRKVPSVAPSLGLSLVTVPSSVFETQIFISVKDRSPGTATHLECHYTALAELLPAHDTSQTSGNRVPVISNSPCGKKHNKTDPKQAPASRRLLRAAAERPLSSKTGNFLPEHFHKQFDLNVLGLLLTTQEAVDAVTASLAGEPGTQENPGELDWFGYGGTRRVGDGWMMPRESDLCQNR
jgi:hypothetical protein